MRFWSLLQKLIPKKINRANYLRPPGAIVPETAFVQRCIKCNQCGQVCPYQSIKMYDLDMGGKYGTPVIYAREMPCYLCLKCPPVCPSGALASSLTQKEKVHLGVAAINTQKCLPYLGENCRLCYDQCPLVQVAITLENERYPKVHEDKCTGCGICEHVCPAKETAITVRSNHLT